MLKAFIQPVTPFQQNAIILYCDETKKSVIVDPGGDIEKLLDVSKKNKLMPEKFFSHMGILTMLEEQLNYLKYLI